MRADLRDSYASDLPSRVRHAIDAIGGNFQGRGWAIGVDAYSFRIGDDLLTIYSDEWTVDVEGPENCVKDFVRAFEQYRDSNSD